MRHSSLIVLLFFLQSANALAQLSESIIVTRFNSYNNVWHKNKILLITNQDKFLASDTIFLKCYLLNEDLSLEKENQLVTVTLVDSNGKASCQIKFIVKNGLGENQLVLPKELLPGIYLLTAYTNWMRNFDTSYFFKKEIVVVKSNKVVPVVKPFMKFAIEGGQLIVNKTNKLVFSCDKPGSVAQLMDSFGNRVVADTVDANGMGSLAFVPNDGITYKIGIAGDATYVQLPRAEKNAVALRITAPIKDDSIKVSITATEAALVSEAKYFLILSGSGKILFTHSFILSKNFSVIPVFAGLLSEGVYSISLLDRNGNIISRRDFYSSKENGVSAKFIFSKDRFLTNDSSTIRISLHDVDGKPIKATFTVNLINKTIFEVKSNSTIKDELKIFYGRKGRIAIDRTTSNWAEVIDNYLILNPELLPWNDILKTQPSIPRYPRTNIIQRKGLAYFADGKKMLDSLDIFFYSQKSKVKYQTKLLKGKVWVPLPTLYGRDELFYLAESFYYQSGLTKGFKLPNLRVKWELDSIELPRPVKSKELNVPDYFGSFKEKINLLNKSFSIQSPTVSAGVANQKDFENEIKGVDVVVNVEDYVVFPTMAELIKEVVPSLFHRYDKGKEIVRVILPGKMAADVSGDPVYLIDGIATNNTDFFLSIKPVDLVQIKVVNNEKKLKSFGLMGKNGIVIVQTKQENMREPIDVSNLIDGLNTETKFPNIVSKLTETPKFRSTVYWNSGVKTDEKGTATVRINLSDDIGEMEFRIDGITESGIPFSASYPINIGLAKRVD